MFEGVLEKSVFHFGKIYLEKYGFCFKPKIS